MSKDEIAVLLGGITVSLDFEVGGIDWDEMRAAILAARFGSDGDRAMILCEIGRVMFVWLQRVSDAKMLTVDQFIGYARGELRVMVDSVNEEFPELLGRDTFLEVWVEKNERGQPDIKLETRIIVRASPCTFT